MRGSVRVATRSIFRASIRPSSCWWPTTSDACSADRRPGRKDAIRPSPGFVEPGESLEEAVRSEVREETGVHVDQVDYHSSQPWPFPSSLMLGFSARPAGGEIALRDGELEDARWVDRDDIAARRVLLPPVVSIAYRLIEEWFDAAPGRRLADEAEPGPWIPRPEA
jgi:NAD+ diphosphatase